MSDDEKFWAALGIDPVDETPRSVPVRLRMDQELVDELQKMVDFAAQRGVKVTRSELIRTAVENFVQGFDAATRTTDAEPAPPRKAARAKTEPRPGTR